MYEKDQELKKIYFERELSEKENNIKLEKICMDKS
jgi:hypothetical protein